MITDSSESSSSPPEDEFDSSSSEDQFVTLVYSLPSSLWVFIFFIFLLSLFFFLYNKTITNLVTYFIFVTYIEKKIFKF